MDKDQEINLMIEKTFRSADANKHLVGLSPTDLRIVELIHRNDFVTALWIYEEDGASRLGIRQIKGVDHLADDGFATCVTIPCADEAAAKKLVELYGSVAPVSKRAH